MTVKQYKTILSEEIRKQDRIVLEAIKSNKPPKVVILEQGYLLGLKQSLYLLDNKLGDVLIIKVNSK
jgi:hypothetical protein